MVALKSAGKHPHLVIVVHKMNHNARFLVFNETQRQEANTFR